MEAKSGILLINKEANMTSFDVVNKLRRIFFTKSIGHTGTLDPNATGLLVCLIGNATKIQSYLKSENKTYHACLKLGYKTKTGDIWGDTIESKQLVPFNENDIILALNSFLGKSYQTPPMTSAIKYKGKKLVDYQREGIEIKREKREIYISSIDLLSYTTNTIEFKATVSSGTYIRTLCEDIAEKLNNLGTMSYLNRISTDKFSLENAYKLSEVNIETPLLPIETILDIEKYEYENVSDIYNGRNIKIDFNDELVLITHNYQAIAIYRKENDFYHCERGLW